MARVIDTITISDFTRDLHRRPLPSAGDGLRVILDPDQPTDCSGAPGRIATIRRPDGTLIEREIAAVEFNPGGVASLLFAGLAPGDVPRLSEVTW